VDASEPNDRTILDTLSPLGIATTRYEDRIAAALGGGGHAQPVFEPHHCVNGAGILFLLPALLSQGLLKASEVYSLPPTHYYGLGQVMLTLGLMALARIKNPEQLKQCRPGEIGRIIGLDRIPEVSCLREKIKMLSTQEQGQKLNRLLVDDWYSPQTGDDGSFLYIDGHVRIYYGAKANLPSKFVSRQKLCLSATTEYWVNDAQGMPVMMVMGELTEKLQHAIEHQIIPQLQQTVLLPASTAPPQLEEAPLEEASLPPACTLVFDREAYDIPFIERLWKNYRIAVITYRKNVKDKWPEEDFTSTDVVVLGQKTTMQLCERNITLGSTIFREVRKYSEDGHQTSIFTNNMLICTAMVAGRMFGRWVQENFFRYLIMDYDFDKMLEFGVEAIDEEKEVVNPIYRKLSQKLKKEVEKRKRLQAQQYALAEQSIDNSLEHLPAITQKQVVLFEKIEQHQQREDELKMQRSQAKPRIKLKEMPDQKRYNKLKQESKMIMNIIKMIAYRAETGVANLLAAFMCTAKADNEKRMLLKQIIQCHADIEPDMTNQTLTITLHTLSAPRFNVAASKLAELLTETECIFPETNLKMIFKTHADQTAKGKEF